MQSRIKIEHEDDLLKLIDSLRDFERNFKIGHRFNLFEAVNMSRQEIRHSRFLAYLLSPTETHGLGDSFLRAVLMKTVEGNTYAPVSRLDLAICDLGDAAVHCERDHFDITVQIPKLELMFVIENKIGSLERQDQLKDYRERVEAHYPNYKFLGCFLTPDGYSGEDDNWSAMSYSFIASELRRIQGTLSLSDDVSLAISHYVDLIERKIVASDELIKACRDIYRQHRTALDLIIEYGQESVLSQAFALFLEDNVYLKALRSSINRVYFYHSEWLNISEFPKADALRWAGDFPVLLWFELSGGRLHLRLEVGPLQSNDNVKRSVLIHELRSRFKGKDRQSRGNTYTRIKTISHQIPEDCSVEDLYDAMKILWGNLGGDSIAKSVADAVKACMASGNA